MKRVSTSSPMQRPLVADYLSPQAAIKPFFNYEVTDEAFKARLQKIQQQTYKREELTAIITQFMKPYGISPQAQTHLQQLAAGGYAIVGGQQVGVFTGPLYSVHKAITVIQMAKQQSAKLGVAVVPIFWVAGEDHDIDEINHTYTHSNSTVQKRTYGERITKKTMASKTPITEDAIDKLIRKVVQDYGETAYTTKMLAQLQEAAQKSATFTDFFMYLMQTLFADAGLLFIDAADDNFRTYESEYFVRLIEAAVPIAEQVAMQEQQLDEAGYGTPIFANAQGANLFYVLDGERHLLVREGENFINAAQQLQFTKQQLVDIARNTPQNLSNNVVTRPLMQEMTLPVLAFVGGPGELAYWATLKPAFEALQLDMPIFVPRYHITLVTRQTEQTLAHLDLTVEQALQGEAQQKRDAFIAEVQDTEALAQVEAMKQQLAASYAKLEAHLSTQQINLQRIVTKNQEFHQQQFLYLQKQIGNDVKLKHQVVLSRYEQVQNELQPNNGPQERTYNPYQYINLYGESLINDLLTLSDFTFTSHNIVYL